MDADDWVCLEWKRSVKGRIAKLSDDKRMAFVLFVDPVPLSVSELLPTKPPAKKKAAKAEGQKIKNQPKDELLCCSFCGKSQNEVKKLIAGPAVYICDECIGICDEILEEDEVHRREPQPREGHKMLEQLALAYLAGWVSSRRFRHHPFLHLQYFLSMVNSKGD